MITTVTLSPCMDKTLILPKLSHGCVNRAVFSRLDIGGKGINVSRALAMLKIPSTAVGFNFGGGEVIINTLEAEGIKAEFADCRGNLRTNIKITETESAETVEINEENPAVSESDISRLEAILFENAASSEYTVLAGSAPKGTGADIYRRLADCARAANPSVKVILDTSGEYLKEGLSARPFMIKPNRYELSEIAGRDLRDFDEIVSVGGEIIAKYGVKIALVSCDEDGAVIITEDESCSMSAVKVEVKSTQGAGDSMLAGAIYALLNGLSAKEILRYGICAAAGAISGEGTTFCREERLREVIVQTATR